MKGLQFISLIDWGIWASTIELIKSLSLYAVIFTITIIWTRIIGETPLAIIARWCLITILICFSVSLIRGWIYSDFCPSTKNALVCVFWIKVLLRWFFIMRPRRLQILIQFEIGAWCTSGRFRRVRALGMMRIFLWLGEGSTINVRTFRAWPKVLWWRVGLDNLFFPILLRGWCLNILLHHMLFTD